MAAHPYPVQYDVARPERYNRWTVAFRLILAIPHLILVGSGGIQLLSFNFGSDDRARDTGNNILNGGVLTMVAAIVVFIAWFAILFTGRYPLALRGFVMMVYRWGQNVHAYVFLLTAPYPPFGDGPYPVQLEVTPAVTHHRWSVFLRLILAIPHLIVLSFLGIAQFIVTFIAWFAILFTGQYPVAMFEFSVGVARWYARVLAYLFLFVDEYPPFTLASESGTRGWYTPQPA